MNPISVSVSPSSRLRLFRLQKAWDRLCILYYGFYRPSNVNASKEPCARIHQAHHLGEVSFLGHLYPLAPRAITFHWLTALQVSCLSDLRLSHTLLYIPYYEA